MNTNRALPTIETEASTDLPEPPSLEAGPSTHREPDGKAKGRSGKPAASIILCSHNGADGLRKLVPSLAEQMAGRPLEIVVVDSASRPEQSATIAEIVGRLPGARLVRLAQPGLSVARNEAVRHASADWLVLIDDDEVPVGDWAAGLLALIARLPANCGACGANVVPIYPSKTTHRVSARWLRYLSMIQMPGEFDQTAVPQVVGGHVLLRAQALRQVGGFDARLGRTGGTLLGGEEALLLRRLARRGWTIWHSASIAVGHHVPPRRLTRAWARDRAYWEGVTTARLLSLDDEPGLRKLARATALKQPLLWVAAMLLRSFHELDFRWCFVAGVRSELARLRSAGNSTTSWWRLRSRR